MRERRIGSWQAFLAAMAAAFLFADVGADELPEEALTADQSAVGTLLATTGISKGICSVPECEDAALALDIAKQTDFLVHAFDTDRQVIATAIDRCNAAGYDRNRMVLECLPSEPLPYAGNFIDLLVIGKTESSVQVSEMARVVHPRGWALLRVDKERTSALKQAGFDPVVEADGWQLLRKRELAGMDDWSHWYHQPDNNPMSTDRVIKAPYLTQWLGIPYYHAMPVVSTVAAGRVFVASGHIAHHDREIPTLNTLVARNGYNGAVLWQRVLADGYLVHRSAFIATPDVFYMIDGEQILCLEPETGSELERLQIPGAKGTLVWIAKVGTMLYALAGEDEPPAEILKVHSEGRGWGWDQVDRNYSPGGENQIRWGFGESLVAYDLQERQPVWHHEQPDIDSRALGILGDRLFYYVPGKKLACLDRRSGAPLWTNEDQEHLALIELEAQGLVGTPGFRTSSMLLATPVGLFMQGQKRLNVLGFSVEDGHFLWSKRKFHNNPNMVYVNGQLLISGVERNGAVQVIDPATGDTLENLNFWKSSCARLTGSPEALYCRGEGLGRYDFETRIYTAERTARPGCNDGAIPANGLLYVGPWLCDCNLSMLGHLALGPALDFDAHGQRLTGENLQLGESTQATAELAIEPTDWPAYRGNNQRTAATAATVPEKVHMLWRCSAANSGVLQAQVVAVGERAFAAGDDGVVRCIDTKSGETKWRFVTGGPVLASPTVWEGRLFVGSGDGYVYCLDAQRGTLLWRFRVAPLERRIMVYGRLASTWPVNSGVLVHNAVAYAAAGIMFRDGTHVVALNARTGQLLWHNGTTGKPINDRFELQAASALGTLTIGKDQLWLASGNVVAPVSFDLKTGESRVMPANREPEWNAVMAQTPEPAGKDIMVFADRFLMHGGRLLYSGEGPVVSSAQVSFRALGEEGQSMSPAFTPVRFCAIPPAWDADVFVMPTSRYGDVLGWNTADVQQRLQKAHDVMVAMDKEIPGDTPQKWGQYNLIGRVFNVVERQLRSTSQWPAVRRQLFALAVARNAVIMTERGRNPAAPCSVAAYNKDNGQSIWRMELPAEPRLGGIAVCRNGSILVTLVDGSIVCMGG